MQLQRYDIEGPVLILPRMIADERGYFMETFRDDWFRASVADTGFVQDNQSLSRQAGVVRGLHYQSAPFEQGKLVRCLKGAIFDVAVDIRPDSATFGRWVSATLTAEKGEQLWVPEGFAHGFCTLLPDSEVFYKCTNFYSKPNDCGLAFDDPEIGISWPVDVANVVLSDKDRSQPPLSSLRA